MIRYRVELSGEEVEELRHIVSKGAQSTQQFRAAVILLACDEGSHAYKVSQQTIAQLLCISPRTIERVKKKFCEEGWQAALERKPSCRTYERKVDGEVEARLVQLCCSEPPKGRARWTLRLLADKMVELQYVESLSYVTVREVLKKTSSSPGRPKSGSFRQNKAVLL